MAAAAGMAAVMLPVSADMAPAAAVRQTTAGPAAVRRALLAGSRCRAVEWQATAAYQLGRAAPAAMLSPASAPPATAPGCRCAAQGPDAARRPAMARRRRWRGREQRQQARRPPSAAPRQCWSTAYARACRPRGASGCEPAAAPPPQHHVLLQALVPAATAPGPAVEPAVGAAGAAGAVQQPELRAEHRRAAAGTICGAWTGPSHPAGLGLLPCHTHRRHPSRLSPRLTYAAAPLSAVAQGMLPALSPAAAAPLPVLAAGLQGQTGTRGWGAVRAGTCRRRLL